MRTTFGEIHLFNDDFFQHETSLTEKSGAQAVEERERERTRENDREQERMRENERERERMRENERERERMRENERE